ncbi:MAG: class III lanthionine synthetase LanKC [Bifidobacterium subtile]|nr:class III lanthionine synthetase LanKC [Bifidobacterium subtile]
MNDISVSLDSYVDYAENKDSYFYCKPIQTRKDRFKLPPSDQNLWSEQTNDYWTFMMRKGYEFPDQGWKIHITSTVREAQWMLYEVASFLLVESISFKFVPSENALMARNGKYADRSSSGKFITVYPDCEKSFLELLDPLKAITDKYDQGPYILSDKQWRESNVFFRYGGLKDIEKIIGGRNVSAIMAPDGTYIEDERKPVYSLPSFIEEPAFITEHNTFPDSDVSELNKYKITSVLHFSNGGGVYVGTFEGKKAVIKEGRRHAGLGGSRRSDSFHRLRDEYVVLKRLDDVKGIVRATEFFTIWQHDYLAEEYVEGMDLQQFITSRFPFSKHLALSSSATEYLEQSLSILEDLESAIERTHSRGYAICDLSLSNVIVDPNSLAPTIIDLEAAKPLGLSFYPDISTPGFSTDKAKTFEEQDWFAFTAIANAMLMPTESLNDLAPSMMISRDAALKTQLGEEAAHYLSSLRKRMIRKAPILQTGPFINTELKTPTVKLNGLSLNDVRQKLFKGLSNNIHPDNLHAISGDLSQYTQRLGDYNVANGIFGVLLALRRTDAKAYAMLMERHGEWFNRILAYVTSFDIQQKCDFGLFTGLSGIASVIYEMGYYESARELFDLFNDETTDALMSRRNVSIYSGLSGIGLALLAMSQFRSTSQEHTIDHIADVVQTLFVERRTNDAQMNFGLLTGWTGAALFLWKYGIMHGKNAALSTARLILSSSCVHLTAPGRDEAVYLLDRSRGIDRFLPYLENGSTGIALALIEMEKDMPGTLTATESELMKGLIASGDMFCSYSGGLFGGYAGFLPLANALRSIRQDSFLQKDIFAGLNLYLLSEGDDLLFPGTCGYKCSMDISTGAAGVLLALDDADADQWGSWLPLPLESELNLMTLERTKKPM